MFIDARNIPNGSVLSTGVCVIGAGPAGMTIAGEFRKDRQVDVCVLESGTLEPDPGTQSLSRGKIVGLPYYPLDANRQRCFGGTLRLWAGWCRPLDEIDLQERPWVPHSGWSIPRSQIEPYYQRAHDVFGLGPLKYDVAYWEKELGIRRIPFAEDCVVTRVYRLAEPSLLAQRSREQLDKAENVRVLLHANAMEIESNDSAGSVTGVRVGCLQEKSFQVTAKLYVLATGGIENARLLLISNKIQKAGLGNTYDLVGRFFMEHICFPSGLIRLSNPAAVAPALYFRGASKRGAIARLFLSPEVQAREELLNYSAILEPLYSGVGFRMLKALENFAFAADRLAIRHRHSTFLVRRLFGKAAAAAYSRGLDFSSVQAPKYIQLAHTLEQAPNPHSRVTLATERDALGLNRVQLDWQTTSLDRRTPTRSRYLIGQEFARTGLGQLQPRPEDDDSIWPPEPLQGLRGHHMGTTRMHPDPRQGVVDEQCRVHGISNLFIAGSSVFPTSGAGTPTITIVALALRLADHLNSRLKDG